MNNVATYDLSGLNEFISGLEGALLGAGAEPGDCRTLLKTEAGQLAWRISESIGPRNLSKATTGLEWEMKRHLTTAPKYSKFDEPQESSQYADFTWLTAGKGRNGKFVLGINNEDLQTSADAAAVLQMYRAGQKGKDRGDAYQKLGWRGQSKKSGGTGRVNVLRLNRIKVSQAAFNAVRRKIADTFGQAKASFARTAAILIPKKRIPAWVRSKFDAVEANGKTIFNDSALNDPQNPYIEFGSRARGVTSNPDLVAKIQGAVQQSQIIVFEKLKKIISGYKYDWETGRVFRPQIGEEDSE